MSCLPLAVTSHRFHTAFDWRFSCFLIEALDVTLRWRILMTKNPGCCLDMKLRLFLRLCYFFFVINGFETIYNNPAKTTFCCIFEDLHIAIECSGNESKRICVLFYLYLDSRETLHDEYSTTIRRIISFS